MKKFLLCISFALLTSCSADLSQFANISENSSYKSKMKTCLISEANSRLQAGTLFNSSISATAKELVSTCVQNLALQSVGIEQESQSTAESIIQGLKNLTANKN